jgi:DNA-binding PadR family transcriptional regulator
MKVGLKILEHSDIDQNDAYFSKLVKELRVEVSRQTIHQSLDSLIDQGTISSRWTKNEEDRWVRGYRPASEGQKRLLRRTYYATHDEAQR